MILFAIIGFFLKVVHGDAKKAVEEVGKNKGRIELVEKQLANDVNRIEQTTQLELRNLVQSQQSLTNVVAALSNNVDMLVRVQLENSKYKEDRS